MSVTRSRRAPATARTRRRGLVRAVYRTRINVASLLGSEPGEREKRAACSSVCVCETQEIEHVGICGGVCTRDGARVQGQSLLCSD
eukprot:scaffold19760_cov93-Phaeocystis_antarctica.AAC.1